MKKNETSTGFFMHNMTMEEEIAVLRLMAEKNQNKTKMDEIGKKYKRVPHPTLRNTFILTEKKEN